jgi:hypothetical protein
MLITISEYHYAKLVGKAGVNTVNCQFRLTTIRL